MTDHPIRRAYVEQLDGVHEAVVELGAEVCDAVVEATRVLLERDLGGARQVVEGDVAINAATVAIEERCTELLVTQGPVAGDLRALLSALRVATEIERCGDLATNIAKTARRLHDVELAPRLRGMISRMGDLAVGLLRFSLDAYESADEGRAAALDDLDDELDELHRDFVEEVLESRSVDAVDLRVGVQLALLGRYYERLGDHAVNVGERVRYRVSGWQPDFEEGRSRHEGATTISATDLLAEAAPSSVDTEVERRRVEALRRDFVANIGHELRTPVGAMVVLAETLAQETDDLGDQEAAATIHRLSSRLSEEASRLGSTIDDLLELSRIEAGEPPVRTVETVSELLEAARQRTQPAATLAGVDLAVRGPEPGVDLAVDRRQLVSALANLLDNAIKYSGTDAKVELEADVVGETVRFMVRDHGIGIPATDQSRIFERFYRVDRARRRDTGGTGLGLAIVRHVALNHGGTVSVSSVEGEGAMFMLVIPRADAVNGTGGDGSGAAT
ncbi:MAG TPA: phosphate signaling complex protein PhoU [Acidimicrobiales bacterium]|nr:phosphate signaling complex protein PhoU [Acidimicrobiales bacterium]